MFSLSEDDPNISDKLALYLEGLLTDERAKKVKEVVSKRKGSFIPIFENIYDEGNMSAAMRSAEAFGFYQFYVLDHLNQTEKKKANRVTRGADKWLDISYFNNIDTCLSSLEKKNYKIIATHLKAEKTIDEISFNEPIALVFGNEKDGVTQELMEKSDEVIRIPMNGFCESFNISVAAALFFYQAHLDKSEDRFPLSEEEKLRLKINYYLRCLNKPEETLTLFYEENN